MNTISSIQAIRNIPGRVFVRWSKSLDLDNARGYSLRHGTQAEAGISVCDIDKSWPDWRILRQIQEYSFLGGNCYIVSGAVVGNGGDDEPVISGITRAHGQVSSALVNTDWAEMWRGMEIARQQSILASMTDEIGQDITRRYIARLQRASKWDIRDIINGL